jgi:hypothetical protein
MFTKKISIIICLFITFFTFSQDWTPPAENPGFGDSNNDAATNAPSLPIDSMLVLLVVVGMLLAFYVIKKKQTKVNG